MRERLGLAFFTFAAVMATLAAWEQPTILAWLYALHNAILVVYYARRKPALRYDRKGLWLGLAAAVLPMAAPYPQSIPPICILIGLSGYCLVLWSLLALGSRFGIAPADRGLVASGPYRWVRHPMYLGELVLRLALLGMSLKSLMAVVLLVILIGIQVVRAQREERIIDGYPAYAGQVRYRLLPGVW